MINKVINVEGMSCDHCRNVESTSEIKRCDLRSRLR